MKFAVSLGACISTLFSGCNTAPTPEAASPALISNPSEASRQIITRTVSEGLKGRSVLLSLSDFTKRNILIIEPREFIGPDGLPVLGRMTKDMAGPIDHFHLMKRGDTCFLLHKETGTEHILKHVQCEEI